MNLLKPQPKDPHYLAMVELMKLREPEVKAAAIERGYPLAKLKESSMGEVYGWLLEHFHDPVDKNRLMQVQKDLPEITKLGGILKMPKVETPEPPKLKITRTAAPRKEKDAKLGIFKGTKKEYTYHLSQDLYTKFSKKYTAKEIVSKFSDQLYQKVTNKFGQVSEKSVKIWMKRYLDTQKWK